jgi:hypothetical protein
MILFTCERVAERSQLRQALSRGMTRKESYG